MAVDGAGRVTADEEGPVQGVPAAASAGGGGLKGTVGLFAVLLLFWFGLTGKADTIDIVFGVTVAAIVTGITKDRLFASGDAAKSFGFRLRDLSLPALVRYGVALAYNVVKANLEVAYLVLHPRLPIDPALLEFETGMRNSIAQVTLAHSITLTPGTITVDLREGHYLIHVLVPRSADNLISGSTQRQVARVFGEAPDEAPDARWARSIGEARRWRKGT